MQTDIKPASQVVAELNEAIGRSDTEAIYASIDDLFTDIADSYFVALRTLNVTLEAGKVCREDVDHIQRIIRDYYTNNYC